MAWIPSYQSLGTHRKTLRMAALLSVDRAQVIGHLHLLWWWAMDNAGNDGELKDSLDGEIAAAGGWPGDAALFVASCIRAGFIDERDGKKSLHNWEDYGGKIVRERASNRRRMKKTRAANVQRTFPVRAPLDKTRQDKIREEPPPAAAVPSPPLPCPPPQQQQGTAAAAPRVWPETTIKPFA